MTPFTLRTITLALATALVAGCGGGEDKYSANRGATSGGAGGAGGGPKVIDPANSGTIKGTVMFEGTPPERKVINMEATPQCADIHAGEVLTEYMVVGDNGGLANCFVYVETEGPYAPHTTPAVLDQKGCQYVPHVLGVMIDQELTIKNSDPFLHNVHYIPVINKEDNIAFGNVMERTRKFTDKEVMVKFKCEVHPWMGAWVGVLDHPFFNVSAADGTFEISNVPAGTHTLKIWHEQLGEQQVTVTVTAGGEASASFTYQEQ